MSFRGEGAGTVTESEHHTTPQAVVVSLDDYLEGRDAKRNPPRKRRRTRKGIADADSLCLRLAKLYLLYDRTPLTQILDSIIEAKTAAT